MNMQVVHGNAAEIEVMSARKILKEVETANEAHLMIETERKILIEIRIRADMTNVAAVRWTDITAILVVSETIARETINPVDDKEDHHRTVKIHRLRTVTAQMVDIIPKNHTIKNQRSTRKSPPNAMTAQMMIVTSKRKRKKVNAADPDQDEPHKLKWILFSF